MKNCCTVMLAIAAYLQALQDLSDFESFSDRENLVSVNFVEFYRIRVIRHLWPAADGWRAKVWCRINVGFVTK